MSAATKIQLGLAAVEDHERERDEQLEIEAGYRWRDELWSAIRTYAITYGYDRCAADLDRRWSPLGRPVSPSALRAALHDAERNNFRAEWLDYFAARDERVADVLARRVKPEKTDRQALDDLEAEMRAELSHTRAEAVLRRARAR